MKVGEVMAVRIGDKDIREYARKYWREETKRTSVEFQKCVDRGEWEAALTWLNSGERFRGLTRIWSQIPANQRAEVLSEFWSMCDDAGRFKIKVVKFFREVGYIGDIPCPVEPIKLYRGVDFQRWMRGVSWTEDLERARWFAGRFGAGIVYTVVAAPEDVLGGFGHRKESEYVLDIFSCPRPKRIEQVRPNWEKQTP